MNGLADTAEEGYQDALRAVCLRYWKPVYTFTRAAWAKDNEEAKDLTQAFFMWLLESSSLRRFDPARGSFRTYLKVMLRSFVGHREIALARVKRGGTVKLISLDNLPGVGESLLDRRAEDPEALFDRVWITDLVSTAVARVRERYVTTGRSRAVQLYELCELATPAERPSYKVLARQFGLTERQVKKQLFQIREDIREELRRDLASQTSGPRELDDEWNALLGS